MYTIFVKSSLILLLFLLSNCKNLVQLERKNLLLTGDTSKVTFTSATLTGEIIDISSVASGKIVQHGHCWSLESGKATVNSKDTTQLGPRDSSGIYTSNIKGLRPNSIYYVRGYVTSSKETVYGDEVLLFTKNGSSIKNIGVANITSSTATATAFIAIFGLNILQYGHCWSSTDKIPSIKNNEGMTNLTTSLGTSGNISYNSSLTNLSSGKTYYIRAYHTLDIGGGQTDTRYGEVIVFKTL